LMHVQPGGALADLRHWLGAGNKVELEIAATALEELNGLADELHATRKVDVRPLQASGSVLDEVSREMAGSDAALLIVGARGSGFMRKLPLGTTAERLLRRATRPMLIVRQAVHEPYRRALVAVDFSPWSLHAIATARRFAPHAQLVLLNAFEVPFEAKLHYSGVDAGTVDRYRLEAGAQARKRLADLALGAGLRADQWVPCIVEGEASQRIVEQELERDCDLVVLGKHGRSAAEELLLGSVTKHVLAEGTMDVLVSTARES